MPRYRLSTVFVTALAVSACAQLPRPEPGAAIGEHRPEADAALAGVPSPVPASITQPQFSAAEAVAAAPVPPAPPEPPDLWVRIRNGFAMVDRQDPRVEAEVNFFAARPDYLERLVDRAEPYLHYIVDEIERRGMPMELALLPAVESAFQPFAYSPGRAAGIWQFIPSTGRHYGLKQTWWYDGRRDVIASTQAALDYLQRLHGYFDDWELALAAYNAGEGTVLRAVRENTRRGRPTDFWNLSLPRETRGYVPRLLAVKALIADPGKYDLTLRSLPDEPYLTVVEVGSQIDLALAAELAELPVEELYRLNPGFNRWATDPDGPHLLVVPIEKADRFQTGLAAIPDSQRVRWERHKVRSGETLSHIADRYRTTVAVIKQVNEMRGSMIRAGQHLIVPVASQASGHYVLSASQRLARTQDKPRDGEKRTYTVRAGDTLWDIARAHGVTTGQIASWNGMAPADPIRPGQQLVVWTRDGGATPAVATTAPLPKLQSVSYTVRRGDSLYLIAQKFKVSVDDLRRWNKLPRKGYLQPGQRLTVQVDITRQGESI